MMTQDDEAARERYGGMSVNERLVMSGLIGAWDAALATRDRTALIEILRAVAIGEPESFADRMLQAAPKGQG